MDGRVERIQDAEAERKYHAVRETDNPRWAIYRNYDVKSAGGDEYYFVEYVQSVSNDQLSEVLYGYEYGTEREGD